MLLRVGLPYDFSPRAGARDTPPDWPSSRPRAGWLRRSTSTATARKVPMVAARFPRALTYLTPDFDAWPETARGGLDKENKLGEGIFRRSN